ncbi:SRPBCC family protein [Nocardia vinacea]|uniref:SRPBCC family protein n=1 Tax=Nocardia vinacea TaxID=96468 RepID=A0ABZ1YVB5_9NOCA|nr:SRPBCC family protein [Nocardia vinacea]
MKLENTFSIPVPVSDAWNVLLDIERIAPCVPGATLTGKDDGGYTGKIKVKLGPVGLTYTGVIKFRSTDETTKVAVLEGGGREARGNGTAHAVITCRLAESDGATDVVVETNLAITGKPAQFGRGTLAEVAGTLIGRFAANLAQEIIATKDRDSPEVVALKSDSEDDGNAVDTGVTASATAPRVAAEPIDLLEAAGMGRLKRFGPPAVALLLALNIVLLLRRRHRER